MYRDSQLTGPDMAMAMNPATKIHDNGVRSR
jgi:hypothetical protein